MKSSHLNPCLKIFSKGKILFMFLLMFVTLKSTAQITINGSGSYTTIQAAINAASSGDVIDVPAGTYVENLISTKNLTLRGANVGISAGNNPGIRGAETILDGRIQLNLGLTEFTIDGFTINVTAANAGGTNARLVNFNTAAEGSFVVKNNILNGGGFSSSFGIYSAPASLKLASWEVSGNTFSNFISQTIFINNIEGNTTISKNLFTGNVSQPFLQINAGTVNGINVSENRFSNSSTSSNSITLSNTGNIVNKNLFDGNSLAIGLSSSGSNQLISQNKFENAGIGITLTTANNTVTNNIFTNGGIAFRMTSPGGSGNVLSNNSFLNGATIAVQGFTGFVVNASCNWWGSASPATNRVNNVAQVTMAPWLTDGTDSDIVSPGFQTTEVCLAPCDLQINVSATPETACANGSASVTVMSGGTGTYTYLWTPGNATTDAISGLAAGSYSVTVRDINGCTASAVAVVDNLLPGPVRNITSGINYCTIQAAITAASPNDVIEVDPGNYNEALITINKPLTLKGANAGISIGSTPGVRGPESIVFGEFRTSGAAGTLTIDGFTINIIANSGNGLNCNLGGSGTINFLNNYVDGRRFTNSRGIYTGINVVWNVIGNTITRCRNYGILLDATGTSPTPGEGTFKGNVISKNGTGGMIMQSSVTAPQLITENHFDSCGIIVGAGGGGHTFSRNTFTGPRTAIQNSSNNNTYTENFFNNTNTAINSPVTTGNVAFHNSFAHTGTNILASFGSVMDATCNWYGTTTPVNRVFSGPSVTFLPWLTNGVDADPSTPGFQTNESCIAPCDLQLSTTVKPDTTCFTGSATVNVVSGGSGNYSYSWNTTPIQTTAAATSLVTGNYTVTVNDLNGCSATANVLVGNNIIFGPVHNTNSGLYFCTIQSAINDPLTLNGHTITVAPGVYAENIVSGKNVTLLGANAGVNAGKYPGTRGPESIIEGSIQVGGPAPAPNGFTLDGFTIKATPSSVIGAAANRRLFFTQSIAAGSVFNISNTVFDGDYQGRNLPGCGSGINCAGTTGIYGGTNANWNVSNNTFRKFHYWAILVDGSTSTGIYTGNLIEDNLGGNPGFAGGGIIFQSSLTTSQTVTDNKFVNNVPSIVLGNGGHTISQNHFENTRGIYAVSNDNNVSENFFVNSVSYAFWLDAARTGNVLYHNSFVGGPSPQVYGSTGGIVEATCNWWNSTDPIVVNPKSNSFVVKTPWLTSGTDENLSLAGFQTTAICNVPCDVELSANITHPGCNPEGSVELIATGGTGVYTYGGDETDSLSEGIYNYSVLDANGCSATLIVELVGQPDVTPPTVICKNAFATLINGIATITIDDIDNGSSDECGIATRALSKYSWTCSEIGEHIVVLVVTDINGNVDSCMAIVEIDGSIPDVTISKSILPGFCQGRQVILTATTSEPVSFAWNTGGIDEDINVTSNGSYSITVTNDNGCTNSDTFVVNDYNAALLTSAYTILARKEVHLHGTINVLNGGVGLTSTNTGDKLKLHDKSQVTGATTFVTGLNIEISGSSNAAVKNYYTAAVTLPPFITNPYAGTIDYKVPDNSTVTLTDSIFKKLEIGKNATVNITSSTIYAQEFIVKENATVNFSKCANLLIKKKVLFEKNAKFNLDQYSTTIYVQDGGTSVEFREGNKFYGKVYAPNGEIYSSGGKSENPTLLTGQFIANTVELKDFTTVNWDLNCDVSCSPPPAPACVCIGGISEITFEYSIWDANSPAKTNVKFYADAGLTQLIKDFKDVSSGKVLKLSAKYLPGKIFGSFVYAVVTENPSQVIAIPTSCGSDILGEFYRELYVYSQKDLSKNVCSAIQSCGTGKTLMCHAPTGKTPHTHCVKNKDVAKKLEKADWYLGECSYPSASAGVFNGADEGAFRAIENDEILLEDGSSLLLSASPNPFKEVARINFRLPYDDNNVRLVVFTVTGQEVKRLYDGPAEGGIIYGFDFKSGDLASGIYFYRLETGDGRIHTNKLILNK